MPEIPVAVWVEVLRVAGPLGAVVAGLALLGYINIRFVDDRLEKQRLAHEAALAAQRLAHDAERTEWRQHFSEMMAQYQAHMAEMRRMYENNVALVKGYEALAKDLSGIITLNMQTMTRLVERIDHNMVCPVATGRVDLEKVLAGRGKG